MERTSIGRSGEMGILFRDQLDILSLDLNGIGSAPVVL